MLLYHSEYPRYVQAISTDTSFEIKMMVKIYAIEIIFRPHEPFQSYLLKSLFYKYKHSTYFPNATLTSCPRFFTHFWVVLILLCCCTQPKVSEKSGQLVRVAFGKRSTICKIGTLTGQADSAKKAGNSTLKGLLRSKNYFNGIYFHNNFYLKTGVSRNGLYLGYSE